MSPALLAVLALAYSAVVLFVVAHALRRILPPVRAAWAAFLLSAAVHGVTPFLMTDEERWLPLLLFWLVPHLLVLPLLLFAARRTAAQG